MGDLHNLFGASKAELWQQLSSEMGATYVPAGFWEGAKVMARHGQWTITLDTHSVSTGRSALIFTRLRAPYVNRDGFRFTIYRQGVLSHLGKWLGMQDVVVGHPEFDNQFVVQGNNESKLKSLLGDQRIRELIQAEPSIQLSVQDDEGWFSATFPEGVDELNLQVAGMVTDVARLKSLYELFSALLDHLCRLGSAYQHPPGSGA